MSQTTTQFLPFHVPLIEEDDIRAVREVMESGWITTGPKTAQFEQEFARFVGSRHAVAVNSGTAALHLALEAIGLAEGDEVILPTLTFAATAEAVAYFKAHPVLVDSEPDTFNLDPVQVERAITPRTRAIVPVHFAGHPCDMNRILKIARSHGIKVIEDAAHALPARYRDKMVGTLGDMTCFSFYATKNITTGEGGIATTDRADWAERMHMMRLHGISKDAWKRYSAEGSWRYEIQAIGFKYNLTDMQAAMGISQLAKCQRMWGMRRAIAQLYTDALGALDAYELPVTRADVQHAWHLYVLRVCPGFLGIHRDRVIEELKERGIGVSVHFIPLHLHPYYREKWGYRRGDFPVAEDYFERCISLPMYAAMSSQDQSRVIDALAEIASLYRRTGRYRHNGLNEDTHAGPYPTIAASHSGSCVNYSAQPVDFQQADDRSLRVARTSADPYRWYLRGGKRALDLAGAVAGLLVTLPVLGVCALVVRISSPGPVFFCQDRAGLGGAAFKLLKFRTMVHTADGPRITAAHDPRITRVGSWLRRWKLDELPQLINVFTGEMSLVGPRPEVPEYVAKYSEEQRQVLQCRPGITSPASLLYIDEEVILANQPDREDFYTRVVMPHKLEVDLAYCGKLNFQSDMKILFATIFRLFGRDRKNGIDGPARAGKVDAKEVLESPAISVDQY